MKPTRSIPVFCLVIALASCHDFDPPLGGGLDFYTIDSSCAGRVYVFSANSKNALDHFWDFGDGDTSIFQNPVKVYDKAGTYLVKLTISDMDSELTMERTVHVDRDYDLKGPKSDFERMRQAGDSRREIIFTNKTVGGTSFMWEFGDGTSLLTDSTDEVRHTYASSGGFTVRLSSTNTEGTTCSTKNVEVAP
jgi:PKD repeat protein